MHRLHRILSALHSLFRRDRVEDDLDEELRVHLDMQTEVYVRQGMSADSARRRARLDLGGLEQVKERVREGWFGAHVEGLWRDLRHGARVLRRRAGFTTAAVLTLALGIGATTAIFSLVNGLLLRPLPYRAPERLAQIRVDFPDQAGYPGLTKAELREFGAQSRLFEGFGAAVGFTVSLTGEGEMEQVFAATVTDDLFPLLGVEPAMGRPFGPEDRYTEQRGYRGVLIGYGLWQRRFGGEPGVIGRSLEVDNVARTILGVMPRGFRLLMGPGTFIPADVDVWTPPDVSDRLLHIHAWRTIGRLREGVSFARADEELARIGASVLEKYPDAFENEQVRFRAVPLHGDIVQDARPALLALFGAVGFLLLIACANVTNLLLTHTEGRRREIALRAALGAGRGRILRQLLAESGLLAIAGGAAGLLFAHWGLAFFLGSNRGIVDRAGEVTLDGTVLGFACAIALLTSVVVGAFPALQACRRDPRELIREGGGAAGRDGRGRVRDALVVAEIAVSLILLV
ncbi:MAG TPA: ABC transporter permease, partial [Vicinamibacterales bacterium]|nr:ABC transporter permease [Vicinamibacterales bacterium]